MATAVLSMAAAFKTRVNVIEGEPFPSGEEDKMSGLGGDITLHLGRPMNSLRTSSWEGETTPPKQVHSKSS